MESILTRPQHPAFTFFRKIVSPYDSGVKITGPCPKPVHRFGKATTVSRYNKNCRAQFGLKNQHLQDNVDGRATYYFTADGSMPRLDDRDRPIHTHALVNGDIDCHHRGTLDSALRFARYLEETYFPGLYFEASTNGRGCHFYFLFRKCVQLKQILGNAAAGLKHVLLDLQRFLRWVLAHSLEANPGEDVEDVEVKGLPPVIEWNQDGTIRALTDGTLAKVPRELCARWDEFRHTTQIDMAWVEDRMAEMASATVRFPRKETCGTKHRRGSTSGCVVSDKDLDLPEFWNQLGAKLVPQSIRTSGRTKVTPEDVGIFLMIGEAMTRNMNEDGTLPMARIRANWNHCKESGAIDRAYDPKRAAVLRNLFSDMNLID